MTIQPNNNVNTEQNLPKSRKCICNSNKTVEHNLDPSLPPPLVLSNRQIQYFLKSFVSKMNCMWNIEYNTIESYELMYMFGKGVRDATTAIIKIIRKACGIM